MFRLGSYGLTTQESLFLKLLGGLWWVELTVGGIRGSSIWSMVTGLGGKIVYRFFLRSKSCFGPEATCTMVLIYFLFLAAVLKSIRGV